MNIKDKYGWLIEKLKGDQYHVVGVLGVIGSGKSYKAAQYKELGYTEIAFRDPVVEIVARQLNVQPDEFLKLYEDFKDNWSLALSDTKLGPDPVGFVRGRQLFIGLGQGLKPFLGADVWAKVLVSRLADLVSQGVTKFVIPDVRFWYEAEPLLQLGAALVLTNWTTSKRYKISGEPDESEALATWLVTHAKKSHESEIKSYDLTDYKAWIAQEHSKQVEKEAADLSSLDRFRAPQLFRQH